MITWVLTTYAWYKPAGLAPRLSRAVMALIRAGWGVHYVTIRPPPERHERLQIHLLNPGGRMAERAADHTQRLPWLFYMWNGSRACLRLAQRPEVKCLMAFSFSGAFPLLLARSATRKPLVIFLRSNEAQENIIKGVSAPMQVLYRVFEAWAARAATRLVAITDTLRRIIEQRHGNRVRDKLTVLRNDLPRVGLDREACRRQVQSLTGRANTKVICMSGPFNERKNVEALIAALAAAGDPQMHLLLMGDGPLAGSLKEQARQLQVADRVTFTGWRSDVPHLQAGCDLFVLPSRAEGVSNSLLEALAGGVPCLVSHIPEHVELFGESPVLFDPDNPRALADRMRKALYDPQFLAEVKQSCTKAAQALSFDWDRRIVEIIQESCA